MLSAISLCFGVIVGGLSWNVYQIYHVVPDEDRSLLDKPAAGFRYIWVFIKLFCHYFGDYVSADYRTKIESRLINAGTQYALDPVQFFASKIVSLVFFGIVAGFLLVALDPDLFSFALLCAIAGFFYPDWWLKQKIHQRRLSINRVLPFYLDVIILSIEAGTNLTGGITQAVQKSSDSPLKTEYAHVLRDIRSGKTRSDALRDMCNRAGSQSLSAITNSMIQAERSGSSLAPVLRAQADQLRNSRFLQAEKLAMEAPVKLLGPLIIFIFPTTFLVLSFVVISKAISAGIITWEPLVWAYHWPK